MFINMLLDNKKFINKRTKKFEFFYILCVSFGLFFVFYIKNSIVTSSSVKSSTFKKKIVEKIFK